jgi:hypothetical protein
MSAPRKLGSAVPRVHVNAHVPESIWQAAVAEAERRHTECGCATPLTISQVIFEALALYARAGTQ